MYRYLFSCLYSSNTLVNNFFQFISLFLSLFSDNPDHLIFQRVGVLVLTLNPFVVGIACRAQKLILDFIDHAVQLVVCVEPVFNYFINFIFFLHFIISFDLDFLTGFTYRFCFPIPCTQGLPLTVTLARQKYHYPYSGSHIRLSRCAYFYVSK